VIRIIYVGKIKNENIRNLVKEYKKRISYFLKIEEIEIKEEKNKRIALQKESERIVNFLNKKNFKIVLDRKGKMMDSLEFSEFLNKKILEGKNVDFFIGGPLGLKEEIFKNFDFILSLSKMTFPHELSILILYEQIYRALTIIKGIDYHK